MKRDATPGVQDAGHGTTFSDEITADIGQVGRCMDTMIQQKSNLYSKHTDEDLNPEGHQ